MKKAIAALLCAVFLIMFCGCGTSVNSSVSEVAKFYYCTQTSEHSKSNSVMEAELREITDDNMDPEALLDLYLSGPVSYPFASPFPAGVTLEGLVVNDGTADITLSNQIAQLTDYDATIAFACLVLTASEILDVEFVTIRAEDALILDNPSITLTASSFVFLAENIE